jgi:hypothetical protein
MKPNHLIKGDNNQGNNNPKHSTRTLQSQTHLKPAKKERVGKKGK